MKTGQWLTSVEGSALWFDSGALCLDFAYTGSMSGTSPGELLGTPADLAAWLGDRFDRMAEEAGERELVDAQALRQAIARLARGTSEQGERSSDDIDTINLFATTPDIPPLLEGGQRQAGRSRVRIGQGLSAIARDAVALFAQDSENRLRECAADDCSLLFYDESRTNNRRWCSMQRCGNRAKVRAFRSRTVA